MVVLNFSVTRVASFPFPIQRLNLGRQVCLIAALLICLLGGNLVGLAQPRTAGVPGAPVLMPTASGAPAATPGMLIEPNEDYRIAAGDTVEIMVEDAPELTVSTRVAAAGTIELNVVGKLAARGKTTTELSKEIAEQLRQQEYLKRPLVRVAVRSYGGQYFFVQGAVRSPGVYQTEGRPQLVRLISQAGGLAENAGPTAMIMRFKKKPGADGNAVSANTGGATGDEKNADPSQTANADDVQFITVNLTPIFQQGKFEQNITLEPGDVINIPPYRVFYVAGEVRFPGQFTLKEGTTLRQAISLAQGTKFNGATNRGVIFRDNPQTGKREEIRVDIGAVMDGKRDDLEIMPNDIIIVPNSRTKAFGAALLQAVGVSNARLPIRGY